MAGIRHSVLTELTVDGIELRATHNAVRPGWELIGSVSSALCMHSVDGKNTTTLLRTNGHLGLAGGEHEWLVLRTVFQAWRHFHKVSLSYMDVIQKVRQVLITFLSLCICVL
jgi:hypothetical protein